MLGGVDIKGAVRPAIAQLKETVTGQMNGAKQEVRERCECPCGSLRSSLTLSLC